MNLPWNTVSGPEAFCSPGPWTCTPTTDGGWHVFNCTGGMVAYVWTEEDARAICRWSECHVDPDVLAEKIDELEEARADLHAAEEQQAKLERTLHALSTPKTTP